MSAKAKLAVYKFASCDGCQLSILDLEDELLPLSEIVEIALFPEATRQVIPGPYDITLVEGSVASPEHLEQIKSIREDTKLLITIGACATSGGIQALKNFSNVDDFVKSVYAHPDYIQTLNTSSAISDHVKVDYELMGCPVNKYQLLEVLRAYLHGSEPQIPSSSVCIECKRSGQTCVMVAEGKACLGPVTHAGCGALCPKFRRGCFSCFGPMEAANPTSLAKQFEGMDIEDEAIKRMFRSYYANNEPFLSTSKEYEQKD